MEKRAPRTDFDFCQLLHPGSAFDHPKDVVADPDLTLNEKRAILSAWASDACALEAIPSLREIRKGHVVPFDDIMDALRALDSDQANSRSHYDRTARRRRALNGRHSSDEGSRSPQ
ncbi:hypothetical protein GCM10007874_35960 [Labrys miyagiensis]|uniref:Uncharacterized protein n=1 Tax=Labrys miyagiensis TaxID=346912 RepID=A0ABQ6CPE7_9HYPH|nr:hypothetical protein [Labrys miyagiensis]GLS20579.1 hypothetical protein GCM10007874_35960 [Labrys miyagiensis]